MSNTANTPSATAPVAGAKSLADLEKENQELRQKLAAAQTQPAAAEAGRPAGQTGKRLETPIRFISRYRRYKPHLRQVTEDFGTHQSNRVVTAQFSDLTYICHDAEIASLLRDMPQFRKQGDNRPGGEIWEMLPGENLKAAMHRVGIRDTGEVIHYSGPVDSRMGQGR